MRNISKSLLFFVITLRFFFFNIFNDQPLLMLTEGLIAKMMLKIKILRSKLVSFK